MKTETTTNPNSEPLGGARNITPTRLLIDRLAIGITDADLQAERDQEERDADRWERYERRVNRYGYDCL